MQGRVLLLYLLLIGVFMVIRYRLITNYYHPVTISKIKALAAVKYDERRTLIKAQCEKNHTGLGHVTNNAKWRTTLFYDYAHQLLFCGVSKVSSTTWVTHLMR